MSKSKNIDYYECKRCNLNSIKNAWCPCPRGGCEARIEGTVKIVTTIDRKLTKEQIKWNKDNYR